MIITMLHYSKQNYGLKISNKNGKKLYLGFGGTKKGPARYLPGQATGIKKGLFRTKLE